ncbi:MAG TPA: rRNA adenine N-6-methyltransferase family protein, partial [bacterium]|nr:rRNA adenine N-6-methyltransferase family protein [bacterium]
NIIKGDFLEIDEGFFRTIGKKIKIIGNLPYYVASPILFKLLDMRYYWNTALVMIPEDVALKIVAKTGDKNFGFMGFVFSLLTQSTICYKIKGSAFYPEPEITSVLMKISIPDKPLMEIKNQQLFWSIAPKLFVQRRKTILNVMKNSFHINRETAIEILQKAGIQPQLRSHQIEIPYLIELIKQISKQI